MQAGSFGHKGRVHWTENTSSIGKLCIINQDKRYMYIVQAVCDVGADSWIWQGTVLLYSSCYQIMSSINLNLPDTHAH